MGMNIYVIDFYFDFIGNFFCIVSFNIGVRCCVIILVVLIVFFLLVWVCGLVNIVLMFFIFNFLYCVVISECKLINVFWFWCVM